MVIQTKNVHNLTSLIGNNEFWVLSFEFAGVHKYSLQLLAKLLTAAASGSLGSSKAESTCGEVKSGYNLGGVNEHMTEVCKSLKHVDWLTKTKPKGQSLTSLHLRTVQKLQI